MPTELIVTIVSVVVAFAGFLKAVDYIVEKSKKTFTKVVEPINKDIHALNKAVCSNYIVRFLADIEQGETLDEIEKKRFWENYEVYKQLGGNSYVTEKVNKLKAQQKL